MQAFQNKVRAQLEPSDPALAASFIQAAQDVIDALTDFATSPSDRPHGKFAPILRQPNGHARLQFSAEPGPTYLLQASTNLVEWELIGVAMDRGDGTFEFEDVNASRFPNRFYRVVSP